ncbi:MAG: pilus assembly protein CpaE [Actinomycetota bacterium]|jgi:pilus assembly protein CpaE
MKSETDPRAIPAGAKIIVVDRTTELADRFREVLPDLDHAAEVMACLRVSDVVEMLDDDERPTVLVAGPGIVTRSGLARLELLHDNCPHLVIVLAFTRRPSAAVRDIVRAGAVDMIQMPADDSVVAASMNRAIGLAYRGVVAAQAVAAAANSAPVAEGQMPSVRQRKGMVVTLASATGGCGKTFLATNLAYLLSLVPDHKVCIVDLDLQFGEVSTTLHLRPKYTICDALAHEDDTIELKDVIDDYVVRHESGIAVLAAPRDPSEADRIEPPDVTRILEAVRANFDTVIVDTPPYLSEVVLAAFDMSDSLYAIATLDLPSVRNMGVFLSTMERLKIPADNVRLILNKAERDVGIDVDQVRKLFPQGFSAVLPYAKEVSKSINLGLPVVAASPTSDISKRIIGGFRELTGHGDAAAAMATPLASGWRRFMHRPSAPAVAGS